MTVNEHLIYAALWLVFGVVHSVLAGPIMKNRLKTWLGGGYRFSYNVFALLHIGLVIYATRYFLAGHLGALPLLPAILMALQVMMIVGAIIFVVALAQYDLGRFSGLTQLREPRLAQIEEPLHLAGFHRYVRHPLYSAAHLYLWGSVRTEFDLATAFWASAYLIIGSYFEEQKLIAEYGKAYADYKSKVPAIIPWKGRAI